MYLREIFRALLVCFIVCGLLATIIIALHDWGKPVNQCDLAQETYQKSRLYNTVLRIKNHERSQVRSNARKLDRIIYTIRINFQREHGCDMLRYEQKFMKHYINSPFLSTDRHTHSPAKKDKHRDRK